MSFVLLVKLGKVISFHLRLLIQFTLLCFNYFEIDLWGPSYVISNGCSYYMSIIDVFTRYTWIYFLLECWMLYLSLLYFIDLQKSNFILRWKKFNLMEVVSLRCFPNTFLNMELFIDLLVYIRIKWDSRTKTSSYSWVSPDSACSSLCIYAILGICFI